MMGTPGSSLGAQYNIKHGVASRRPGPTCQLHIELTISGEIAQVELATLLLAFARDYPGLVRDNGHALDFGDAKKSPQAEA